MLPLLAVSLFAPPPVSFLNDVAPILQENCFACHDAKKKSGKYDMTTFAKLRAGGANGDAVVPGKPDDSETYTLMVTAEQRRMPPRDKGEAVPKAKAEVVARWIREGAKLDAGVAADADLGKELRKRWVPPPPPDAYAVPAPTTALAFTPDGAQLVASGQHELTVWDAVSGRLAKRVRTRAERAYGLAFLKDGTLAVAGGRPGQEGDVRVYDIAAKPAAEIAGVPVLDGVNDAKVRRQVLLDTDDSVLCLAVSTDGKKLAAGGTDRTVRVWDTGSWKVEQLIENHSDWVMGVNFAGPYLLTAGRDKTAKAWDLAAKESLTTFPEHQNTVYAVAGRGDGGVAVSAGADKQIRSWKPGGEGKQMRNAGHGDEVLRIAYDPAKNIAYTAAADGGVRAWEVDNKLAAGKKFEGMTDVVYSLALTADGKRLAAAGYDATVRVWDTATGKEVVKFKAVPGGAK